MTAIVFDVHCSDDYCPAAEQCTECTGYVCPEHDDTDRFVQCAADPDVFHHVDACADACPDCHAEQMRRSA